MGNSQLEKANCGDIKIVLQEAKTHYRPGEIINGIIYIDQWTPFEARALQLSFIESEHVYWAIQTDKSRTEYRNDAVAFQQDFQLIDLQPYQCQCQIGKFQFPFSIQVP